MALATSVSEEKWVLQSGGTEQGSYSSTFVRRVKWEAGETYPPSAEIVGTGESKYVYFHKIATTVYLDTFADYKQYALTDTACTDYITAHPELSLSYSRQNEFSNGFVLSKKTGSRSLVSYTLADVPEAS